VVTFDDGDAITTRSGVAKKLNGIVEQGMATQARRASEGFGRIPRWRVGLVQRGSG
jgi:hypothetical protein